MLAVAIRGGMIIGEELGVELCSLSKEPEEKRRGRRSRRSARFSLSFFTF